jgi:molybdopterin-guanine dinucleotide biosynthesis protein A
MRAAGLAPTVVGKESDIVLRALVEAAGCAWLSEPDEPVHPLFGIAFALKELDCPIVVCAADMPFVPPELIRTLAEATGEVVACEVDDGLQPLLGRYSPSVAEELHEAADENRPAVGTLRYFGDRVSVLAGPELAKFGDPQHFMADVDDAAALAQAAAKQGSG